VLGHGSVGIADRCAPSRDDPNALTNDFRSLVYSVAGDGWVSILPDNPGLGTEGPTAWGHSVDEGHSLLDATRAARKLLKTDVVDDQNVLIGHSIGGHAVLSAHAYIDAYGAEGKVVATIAYVPMWFTNAVWGVLLSPIGQSYLTPTLLALSMKYFYGHLAAYEGEDHALDAFLEDKRTEVKDFLEGGCWRDVTGKNGPARIGIPKPADGFLPEYTTEVGNCAFNGMCETALAKTWRDRWTADRPAPVTSVPIVIWQGAKDDFYTPAFQKCGIDRLEAQGADLTVCADKEGDHSTVIADSASWVRRYLREKLLGGEAPPPCAGVETFGADLKCGVPIANSTDPNDP
jgi:pimeloyl-ACP methyl ester carboxylesterase